MADHQHHQHHHHHRPHDGHQHRFGLGALSPSAQRGPAVHRLGRRRFVADLGRGTLALAVLGAAAACSGPADDPGQGAEETQWKRVTLGFVSAYVLVRGNEAAVIDAGVPGSADEIASSLKALGVGWGQVGHVILTHNHADHIGSLPEVLAEAPTATAYAGEADIGGIASPNPLQPVGDGDEVFGLEIIHTPGHTPGSIAVIDHGIGLLVAGDALTGNDSGTEVLGPNARFTADMASANASVRKLAGFRFESAVFGHGSPVTAAAGDKVATLADTL